MILLEGQNNCVFFYYILHCTRAENKHTYTNKLCVKFQLHLMQMSNIIIIRWFSINISKWNTHWLLCLCCNNFSMIDERLRLIMKLKFGLHSKQCTKKNKLFDFGCEWFLNLTVISQFEINQIKNTITQCHCCTQMFK